MTHIRTKHVKKAKKQYKCDVCMAIMEVFGNSNQVKEELSVDDLKLWEYMESKNFTIQVGEPYIHVVCVLDGELVVNRYSSEKMIIIGESFNVFEH